MSKEDDLYEAWKGLETAWIGLASPRRALGVRKVRAYSDVLFEFFSELANRPMSEMELLGRGSEARDKRMTRIGTGVLKIYFGVDQSTANPNLFTRGFVSAIDDSNFGWSAVENGEHQFRFFEPTLFATKCDSFHFVLDRAAPFEVNQGYR